MPSGRCQPYHTHRLAEAMQKSDQNAEAETTTGHTWRADTAEATWPGAGHLKQQALPLMMSCQQQTGRLHEAGLRALGRR